MDGVFDNSPWTHIIQIIDVADRVIKGQPYILLVSSLIVLCYTMLGSWLDLVLIFICLGYHHFLAAFPCNFRNTLYTTSLIPIAGAVVVTSCFATFHFARRKNDWKGHAQPYLIPCKTTHARQFPQRHSFGYSYLVVGVPVGFTGNVNGVLTVDGRSHSSWSFLHRLLHKLLRTGWYTVDASDHMHRGGCTEGLRGKLDTYLKSQGAEPSDYPYAYLVTAARFLGYHFNPVSFWYLYSEEKILSAIVLEVNNTFDERRPYLVLRDFPSDDQHPADLETHDKPRSRVKGSWPKDFHVSPFNSRKGIYSVVASDPLGPGMDGFRGIDVTINLSSSKGHPKLVARLFSLGEAIDPASMGPVAKAKFLCQWFWVGFATFPRIVKEAAILFFQRKLHVWYRPEPLNETFGRHATEVERKLESAFRKYLKFRVEQCQKSVSVRYVSSGMLDIPEETFVSPSWHDAPNAGMTIELKVLTPIFYSRFVQYAQDLEAIHLEHAESATIWVSEPELLPDLFVKVASPPLQDAALMDRLFLKSIHNLRRRPNKIPRVSKSADTWAYATTITDTRDPRISPMDAYILKHADQTLKTYYRSTLLRVFVANQWTRGNVAFLDFGILLLRIGTSWAFANLLKRVASDSAYAVM